MRQMSRDKLDNIINNLEGELKGCYKMFHQHPEVSNKEYETTNRIKNLLEEVDIKVLDLPLKTGLVAIIEGKSKTLVVALRCDIDALEINEETGLSYSSINKGVMHACGHDFHATTILGAAYLLKEKQDELEGTVKLIFQPAEETGHGAEDVIKTGGLDDVNAIFGIHNSSRLNVGEISVDKEPPTAAVDRFEIKINGVGTHGAHPEDGVDPIVISAHIVTALQTIISRNISAFDNALISVTNIHSGTTWNVIPQEAYIEGTVRTLNKDTRKLIPKKMVGIIKAIATSFGGDADFIWHEGPPATDNAAKWIEASQDVAKKNGFKLKKLPQSLGGEDFAYYQELVPGAFIHIGTGESHPHHHPGFTIDTDSIVGAAGYFKDLAIEAINKLNKKH